MKLSEVEILPGVVVVDTDPKKIGRVKAVVPTLFDTATMPTETLPWIYPFTMSHYQSYTRPRSGMKIWVINNTANVNEYWYLPMFELCTDVRDVVGKDDEVDIVMNRNMGGSTTTIYHSESEGMVTKVGGSHMKIKPNGNVEVSADNGVGIKASNGVISLGKKEEFDKTATVGEGINHAAKAENLKDVLTQLIDIVDGYMKEIQTRCWYGYATASASSAQIKLTNLKNSLDSIISKSVCVD